MDLEQDGSSAVCWAEAQAVVVGPVEVEAAEVLADLVAAAVEVAAPAEDGKLNSFQLLYFFKIIFELVKTVTT